MTTTIIKANIFKAGNNKRIKELNNKIKEIQNLSKIKQRKKHNKDKIKEYKARIKELEKSNTRIKLSIKNKNRKN